MPQPNNFDGSTSQSIGQRRCPVCGHLMFLSLIEPTYQKGYDVRTFECLSCAYAEMALTNFE
jgi:hypothetical protein